MHSGRTRFDHATFNQNQCNPQLQQENSAVLGEGSQEGRGGISISPITLLPSQSDDATLRFIWSTISESAGGGEERQASRHHPRATLQRDESNRERGNIKETAPAGLWRRRVVLRTNSAGLHPDAGGNHAQAHRHLPGVVPAPHPVAPAPGRHGGAAGVSRFGVLECCEAGLAASLAAQADSLL
jgi:hypothetical protein